MTRRPGSVRWRQAARLLQAVRDRLVVTLEDEPGDLARRICPHCGAPVVGYELRPVRFGGAGGEVICCKRGHRLHAGEWKVKVEHD